MPEGDAGPEAAPPATTGGTETTQSQPIGSFAMTLEAAHKILIVDDDLWSAFDMEWVIRKIGHDVIGPVASAHEAIKLAEDERPDLILMDIRLASGTDGIAAATEIRDRFDITCIFVSAHGDAATRQRAMAARPATFVEKPYAPEELEVAITAALEPMDVFE